MSSANPNGLEEADFWDWDATNLGEEDIPAIIAAIQAKRLAEGRDCKKVSIVGRAFGVQEANIALAAFPTSSADWIGQVVNLAPCWVPDKAFVKNVTGVDVDTSDDVPHHRMLYHCHFDSHAYYTEFGKIRAALTYSEYRAFYNYWSWWKRATGYYKWQCDEAWVEGLKEAVCKVKPDYESCKPDFIGNFESFVNGLTTLGIYSLLGEEWTDEKQAICDAGDAGDTVLATSCAALADKGQYPNPPQTMGAKLIYQNSQQAINQSFSKYDPDFWGSTWNAEPMNYDLSGNTVPVRNIFLKDDGICNTEVNKQWAWENLGDSIEMTVTFSNDYTSPNDFKGADNSAALGAVLLATLAGQKGADIDGGVCADGTFDLANWN